MATIFAVGDWVEQYESGKHIKPVPLPPQSILQQLKEFEKSLVAFQKQHDENEKIKEDIEKWQPFHISKEYIGILNLKEEQATGNSPEEKLDEFMIYFSNMNYGKMHDIIARHCADKSKGQYIQTIKSYIGDLSLRHYKIVSIKDCAPSISEIEVQLSITDNSNGEYMLNTKCRMIYQKNAFNTSVLVRGNPEGRWFITDFYINEIYNQYWVAKISSLQNN